MAPYNLPDDWGDYYRKCGDCGATYHLSGVVECACPPEPEDPFTGAECDCGGCQWDSLDPDDALCKDCGTGAYRETVRKTKWVVARKRHTAVDGRIIEPGERYRSVFTRGYHPNGPTRMTHNKHKSKERA